MDISERFELVSDDYLKFDRVQNKLSMRPDLHAFLLLDAIFPNPGREIITSASHDEICLDQGWVRLETLTNDQILELVRCGVLYDRQHDCLTMFV